MHTHDTLIERTPPPQGGFPIYYVPSSRAVRKRTPLEEFGTNSSSQSVESQTHAHHTHTSFSLATGDGDVALVDS